MRYAALLLCLLLGACASSRKLERPPYLDPAAATPTGAALTPATAGQLPTPLPVRRGVLGWLPGRRAADTSSRRQPATAYTAPAPRKCKGCTFNVVAGDQQVVGKKSTAAAAGATALGTTTGQAQVGDGNQATMPADTKGGLLAKLKHVLGSAFDYVVSVLVLLMLLVLFRKRFGFPF